jgi:hypothetical protein
MSPTQAVALAVRLFAVWLAIYWALWVPYLYGLVRDSENVAESAGAIGVLVLAILFVLFLWFFPRTVARTLLPEHDSTPITTASPAAWFAVGCALLGLWVLTEALPGLARNVYVLIYAQRNGASAPGWDAGLVYRLVELAIGFWLLLGAAGVRKLLKWAHDTALEQ